jgi:predicted O-methyltransferase YrrM
MASAMPAGCVLITVEIDQRLAAAVAGLMAADHRVEVLAGDARDLLPGQRPFDRLSADGGWRDPAGLASLVSLLAMGGRIVMDDLTPLDRLPPGSPLRVHDVKREFFFSDPRLTSAEVVLPDLHNSLLVGTRHT